MSVLSSLVRAYERLPDVAPLGYSREKIGGLIALNPDGSVAGLHDLRSGSGKKRQGAILSVPRDQYEATTALNLTRWQRMRHVILPQALPLMLPTFGNNAIELLKATAIVSLISLSDMTFQAQVVRSQTGSTLLPFLTILLLYFAMAMAITAGIRALERRVTRGLDGMR